MNINTLLNEMRGCKVTTLYHLQFLLCIEKKANWTASEVANELKILYTTVSNIVDRLSEAEIPLVKKSGRSKPTVFRITVAGRIVLDQFRLLLAGEGPATVHRSEPRRNELRPANTA